MTKLSKYLCATAAAAALASTPVFAGSGIFGTGVVISTSIGGTSALDLFETTDLNDSRLAPTVPGGGVSLGAPTLITAGGWDTGSGPSLGTFDLTPGSTDNLTLDGGELLTFKNGGSDVTGALVGWEITGGSFVEKNLSFNQDNVNGSTGDQRWYSDSAIDANLLSNLPNGTYTLSVYYHATTSDGGAFVSNNSNNFNAQFTVIPEPSTVAMLLTSSFFGSFYLLRRRRK